MSTPFTDGFKDADLLYSQGYSDQMVKALIGTSLEITTGEGAEEYFKGATYRFASENGKIRMPKGEKGKVIRDLFIKNKNATQ